MDPTTWVLDQIVGLFPEGGHSRGAAVGALEGVIGALEGRANGLARDALRAWG